MARGSGRSLFLAWLLLLSLPWLQASVEIRETGRICSLILQRRQNKLEGFVKAIQATWSPNTFFFVGSDNVPNFVSQHLGTPRVLGNCSWLLLVPSLQTYINVPALENSLKELSPTEGLAWEIGRSAATVKSTSLWLLSAATASHCQAQVAIESEDGLAAWQRLTACAAQVSCGASSCNSSESAGLVETGGYHGFTTRSFHDQCLLAVVSVLGWVQILQIAQDIAKAGGMSRCFPHVPVQSAMAASTKVMVQDLDAQSLNGRLCIFIPALLPADTPQHEVDDFGRMAQAIKDTWATNHTVFLVAQEASGLPGLVESLHGLQITRMPGPSDDGLGASLAFQGLRFWRYVVRLLKEGGGQGRCEWVMKVPVSSYVNAAALENRLACFNASDPYYLGVTTAAYTPGEDPFMFPHNQAGSIASRGLLEHVDSWSDYCLRSWGGQESAPYGSQAFFEDYAFALCLDDMGKIGASNFADIDTSFVLYERPAQTFSQFEKHPDTVKQCLLVVGKLGSAEDVRHVHDRVLWSGWHTSIPCIGESQMGKFSISDQMGNKKPYYDERIRLALYYCKAPDMMYLERELSARLDGLDPRSGQGSLKAQMPASVTGRRHLCIFVPSSPRKQKFIDAAEAAWRVWGTNDTFFVSRLPLSPLLDPQTFLLETDVDTDYAHLPVRTFLLFEALGRPEWISACDWYMKADADSFLNVPLIEERLRCFDPGEFWFLGVPQVAHSSTGSMTRFASGGAGYMVSRGLLPKLATWSPFCLLQLLQHSGGTGMEDVSFAGCVWKWGHVDVASYADYETEVITSEAAMNRTRVKEQHVSEEAWSVPPCVFVVHSITPGELEIVADNIARARRLMPSSKRCLPDPARLQEGASTLLSPELGSLELESSRKRGASYQWAVYAEREYKALMACSTDETLERNSESS